jgi:4-nitrophenyl phosphatase
MSMDGARGRALVLDMDGVLCHGNRAAPGLAHFLAVTADRPYVCVTNNSTLSAEDCAARFAAMGVEIPAERFVTVSAAVEEQLAATYPRGAGAYVIGAPCLHDAVQQAGLTIDDGGDSSLLPAVVVVGLDRDLHYRQLVAACRALAAGAGLVAASHDSVLIDDEGIVPATGAIVAALTAVVGVRPEYVGKPGPRLFELALARLGAAAEDAIVVGDSLASDIAGGRAIGASTILLTSGVTSADAPREPLPDLVLPDLPALTEWLTGALAPVEAPS